MDHHGAPGRLTRAGIQPRPTACLRTMVSVSPAPRGTHFMLPAEHAPEFSAGTYRQSAEQRKPGPAPASYGYRAGFSVPGHTPAGLSRCPGSGIPLRGCPKTRNTVSPAERGHCILHKCSFRAAIYCFRADFRAAGQAAGLQTLRFLLFSRFKMWYNSRNYALPHGGACCENSPEKG